jgi:uncharacterized protein with PIN domain
MPRPNPSGQASASYFPVAGLEPDYDLRTPHLSCGHCEHPLECVEQNRRSGTWLGSYMCPNCRSEYFYAYRWGRMVQKA